jgi:uncharacterized protein YndB with AHSA1/START domain
MSSYDSIFIEKTFKAPVHLLWKAITEREHTKKWYFDFPEEFRLKVGQEFEWSAGEPGGKQWLHKGKMLEIEEGKKLVHSWEYPGYSGTSVVTWDLTPIDDQNTRLNFSHVFTIPFDPSEPGFKRENFVAGWNEIINKMLEDYLRKVN